MAQQKLTEEQIEKRRARREARAKLVAEGKAPNGAGRNQGKKWQKQRGTKGNQGKTKKPEKPKVVASVAQVIPQGQPKPPAKPQPNQYVGVAAPKAPPQPKPPQPKPKPKPKPPAPQPNLPPVPPVVPNATMQTRHYMVLFSFFLFVILPAAFVYWYLDTRAADQYASTVGFTVRQEEAASPTDFLGGIVGLSSGSASDTDILYEFIQSQQLISSINDKLDLADIFSKPENDPVFTFDPDKPLEKLVDYWGRMVKIYYDSSTGLIELRVLAFTAEDAQAITTEIFAQSTTMINQLSDIAREDTTRYTRAELTLAMEKLKVARQAVTEFRNSNMIVDPTADIQGKMGLLSVLQQQLAEAMIELDLLRDITRESDPRIEQAIRKTEVIEKRIAEERMKFGIGDGNGDEAYAMLLGQYEILTVEREFAEQTYFAALASYDAAVSEAGRQTRYLAAYVDPTFPQSSQFPQRWTLFGLTSLFLLLLWSISVLVAYSIKDRR